MNDIVDSFMIPISTLIIDDMAIAREQLRHDLQTHVPHAEIVGEADSVVNGLKAIKKHRPQVVLLDIQLGDGTGFDILELLDEVNFKLIFTTASDAFAVRAFRFAAIDYLLKPIDSQLLAEAFERVQEQLMNKDQVEIAADAYRNQGVSHTIALHTLDSMHVVKIDDIVRCKADDNYTHFFFSDGTKLMVSKTLKTYDQMLSDYPFLRVHQSHLVHAKFIKAFVKTDGGYLELISGEHIPVATRRRSKVVDFLQQRSTE